MTKGLTLCVNDDGIYSSEEFDGELRDYQRVVGGNIEAIPTSENVTIFVNEDGKDFGLPINRLAMDVWIRYDVYFCMLHGEWIAGNAVIVGGVDSEGNQTDLSDEDRRWIEHIIREAIS